MRILARAKAREEAVHSGRNALEAESRETVTNSASEPYYSNGLIGFDGGSCCSATMNSRKSATNLGSTSRTRQFLEVQHIVLTPAAPVRARRNACSKHPQGLLQSSFRSLMRDIDASLFPSEHDFTTDR